MSPRAHRGSSLGHGRPRGRADSARAAKGALQGASPHTALHAELAAAAARAEAVAAAVQLREDEHFVRARGRIRQALAEDGVAGEIDRLVVRLFAP